METEYSKLADLQNSLSIESQNIEDLYGIKQNADSLAALLLAYKQEKAAFEQDMSEAKKQWGRETEFFDQQIKDHKARTKKE